MLTCNSHTLCWEIYLGKGYPLDSSAESFVVSLITNVYLTMKSGRILYTSNWYTSIKLARTLFEKYKWLFVGTSVPTKKKTREE